MFSVTSSPSQTVSAELGFRIASSAGFTITVAVVVVVAQKEVICLITA